MKKPYTAFVPERRHSRELTQSISDLGLEAIALEAIAVSIAKPMLQTYQPLESQAGEHPLQAIR